MAWTGHYPDLPNVPVRVEAAAYRGKVVFLQVVAPWTRSPRAVPPSRTAGDRLGEAIQAAIILVLLIGGAFVARRNAAAGRGDVRGARRIALAMFLVFALRWLFGTHHVADSGEMVLFFRGLGAACLMAAWMWLLYVGLEPFVRRRWPHTLIGWNRLLMGRVADPLVGRDLLTGLTAGLLLAGFSLLGAFTLSGAGGAGVARHPLLAPLLGPTATADLFGLCFFQALLNSLGLMFLLFLLRLVLRRDWLMTLAFVVLMSGGTFGAGGAIGVLLQVGWCLVMVALLARFGLLAFFVAWMVDRVLEFTPLTMNVWGWHAAPTVVALVVLLALAAFGAKLALAGRSLLGGELHGE
jgi:serine/threonine-protein kinase